MSQKNIIHLDEFHADPLNELKIAVQSLCCRIAAEHSLAEVRHNEVLRSLQDNGAKLQAMLSEEDQHLQEINTRLAEEDQHIQRIEAAQLEENKHIRQIEISQLEESAHLQQIENDLANASATCGTPSSSKEWADRAKSASQQISEADAMDTKLSCKSTLAFGKKMVGESDALVGITYVVSRLREILSHHWFELFVSALITFNAVVMCFEVQREGLQIAQKLQHGIEGQDGSGDVWDDQASSSGVWHGMEPVFIFFGWFFGIVFLCEACVKVFVFGFQYFRCVWNLIDFVCALAFLVEKIGAAVDVVILDAQLIRLFRLFRLMRLIRLIRTLEHADMLYTIMTAIKGMGMIVLWAVSLLSLMLMTCALFLSQFLQSTYFDNASLKGLSSTDLATRTELYKYFGSFTRCFFTMFEITLANWPPVARLLMEEVSEVFSVICVLHKLTIGFAVIGVINGVILQETFKVAQTDDVIKVRNEKRAKAAFHHKMESLFTALDLDKDNKLTFKEFMVVAAQPDVQLWLQSFAIETDDLLTLFLLIDCNGDGTLTLREVVEHLPRLRGSARGIDMLALRKGVPMFQLQRQTASAEDEETFQWAETGAVSQDEIGKITSTKFLSNNIVSQGSSSLDEILEEVQ